MKDGGLMRLPDFGEVEGSNGSLDLLTFTVITTDPNELVASLHVRR